MSKFIQDLRFGWRMLLSNPGFSLIAIITLALGVGANTAIFSVVNSVLLRPLPFKEPERLLQIRETKLPQFPEFSVSPGNYLDWKKQNTVFEKLVAFSVTNLNLIGTGDPEQLRVLNVTDGYFAMLGAQPQIGRDFLAEEDQPERNNVVILSYGLWQRRFGGNPNILNQSITLSGQSYTVIGVMPQSFQFLDREIELWKPMGFTSQQAQNHGGHSLVAIGQLKTGATIERATEEMVAIADRLAKQYPDANTGWSVKLMPLLESYVRSIKPALLVLLVAVAFVLLIACANVANLLLARAAGRHKEFAIRTALGAGRFRLIRQLLTESILLSLAGGILGLLLANWGLSLLLRLAPANLPRINDVSVDLRVLGFSILVSLITGTLFGLVPALQVSNPNLNDVMKDAGRGSTESGQRQFIRNSLVVLEVASALILVVGAGLMMKSFWHLLQVDPGFNPNNALAVRIELPRKKYSKDEQQSAFFRQLIEKVKHLPGAQVVGAASVLPMSDNDFILSFDVDGRPPLPRGASQSTNYSSISADYFQAMGIPLLKGRGFTDRDTADSPHVAVINETMAKKIFPNEDPLGKRISFGGDDGKPDWYEIVGIVGDVKHYGLDQAAPMQTYEPFAQQAMSGMTLVVRSAGDPTGLSGAIRDAVLSLDKEQPIASLNKLEKFIASSLSRQRFAMLLLSIFAGVALLLAMIGIYGVLSYAVTQRTHEIGIRVALGAAQRNVLHLVMGQGLKLAAMGVAFGLLISFGLTRWMGTLLFEVEAADPLTYGGLTLLLLSIAALACWIPARRATKVDPMIALRYE